MIKESITYAWLGGIESSGFREIPLIPLGRWLMGLAFILFGAGMWLGGRRNMDLFEQVRFGSRRRWWNMRFKASLLLGAAGCILYEALLQGLDFALHLSGQEGIKEGLILLLWLVHMETLVSGFCLLDITVFQRIAPALLFMAELLTFLMGHFFRGLSKFMFGSWGMYVRSSQVEGTDGFSPVPVLILECLLMIVFWRSGAVLLEWEERSYCSDQANHSAD